MKRWSVDDVEWYMSEVIDRCHRDEISFKFIHYILDILHVCDVYSLIVLIFSVFSFYSVLNFWDSRSLDSDWFFDENSFYFVNIFDFFDVFYRFWFFRFSLVKIVVVRCWFEMSDWDDWMNFSWLWNLKSIREFAYLFDDLNWFKSLLREFSVRQIWLSISLV
jgi:hypothetical protein